MENLVEFFTYRPYGFRRLTRQWERVVRRLEGPGEAEYKLAILEADEMLDELLKRIGYRGETLGEKLTGLSTTSLPNLAEALEVHQVRNNIIHDPDYRLTLEEAKRVLEVYERAFRHLEVIE